MPIDLNSLGLVAASTAFLSIWVGHISVRKIEAQIVQLWKPVSGTIFLGLALEYAALVVPNRALSVVCGILGITLLWDAFEIKRQARRVHQGHAPANPHNPRHAAWLADACSGATTLDILKRAPVGRSVGAEEAASLVTNPGSARTK